MNTQFQLLLLGFVLLIVIIISLSNAGPVPYQKNTLFPKEYPYKEGLCSNNNREGAKDKNEGVKTEGFHGLQSSPYGDEKSLDYFSELPSGGSCAPSPYSNSKGYLCLDDKAKNLLLTRGGNQTGQGSQYGSPN
jgi:hypothetical protein